MITYSLNPTDIQVNRILDNLRLIDKVEASAFSSMNYDDAIRFSVINSKSAYYVYDNDNDKPLCLFGIIHNHPFDNNAVPWMVGTDYLYDKKYIKYLYKIPNFFINTVWKEYDSLYNYVWKDNTITIRWLKRLGFEVLTDLEYKFNSEVITFYKFIKVNR